MPKNDQTSAHWRDKLAALAESTETAKQALQDAQKLATEAAFNGGDVGSTARQVTAHRDVLDALEGATREAQHRLEQAEADEAAKAAQIERDKAQQALDARSDAAARIDAALVALGEAHSAFVDHGREAVAHFLAAGDEAPARLRHGSPDALHGAMMFHAPTFHHALRIQRSEPRSRRPLADHAGRQQDAAA
ncbi:MAG: hypothetical protein LC676_09460 [Loktanella sp.]|nr:hypothetical protein [Loktanella sp.]